MKKSLIIFLAAVITFTFCFITCESVSAKTYNGESMKNVTLKGRVKKHIATAANGTKYTAYDLILSKKIKIKSVWWGDTSKEKRIMIASFDLPSKYGKLSKYLGKKKK